MVNRFHGGGRSLDLSNGGTEVFIDILMLAVSDLVEDAWDYRFATLLVLQDQSVMGRGAVGFDLEDIDWGRGPHEQTRAKDFVLRVIALALSRHRWDELGYEPPYAQDQLRQFAAMVEVFDPNRARPGQDTFPGPDEVVIASCVRHRVLSALPHWNGCVFCTAAGGTG